jgi:Ca2+-binding RTX toxin-like protein
VLSNSTRLFQVFVLALAPFWGPGCDSSGTRFVPETGVLTVVGTEGADSFVVGTTANGNIVVNGGAVAIAGGTPTLANTVLVVLQGLGGDDQLVISSVGGPLPDARISGGPGADVLIGGPGNDEIDGGPGDDDAFLGGGDDTFTWVPGDGLDTIEGQGGVDTLSFAGSDAAETLTLFANAGRAGVHRTVDAVTLDLVGIETIRVFPRGGADSIIVGDLLGTEVTGVALDLAGATAGGDGQADLVTVNATNGDDVFGVAGDAQGLQVFGLQAAVQIVNHELANDRLTLNALAGGDVIDATSLAADAIPLVANGGLGNDTFLGGQGTDLFTGGDGNDVALLGAGDDTAVWNPGDDNDTIEGQDGTDTLRFNGANANESIDISSNGGRVRFFRSIASVIADLNDVEQIDFFAFGGADVIAVRDLTNTDVVVVNVALAVGAGLGDAQPDTVLVDATELDDVVLISGDATLTSVFGLAAQIHVTTIESANDSLVVAGFGGDDALDASALAATGPRLTLDGGADHDVLIGGDGADVLLGGEGDDVLLGGPGLDILDGGPGDNVVIQ